VEKRQILVVNLVPSRPEQAKPQRDPLGVVGTLNSNGAAHGEM
jgi:hypothetical protein